jgi:hypothetical protein
MNIRKTKHEGNIMLKVTLVKLVRHDDQNGDLYQRFPNFAARIPRNPRPVTRGFVDTFL